MKSLLALLIIGASFNGIAQEVKLSDIVSKGTKISFQSLKLPTYYIKTLYSKSELNDYSEGLASSNISTSIIFQNGRMIRNGLDDRSMTSLDSDETKSYCEIFVTIQGKKYIKLEDNLYSAGQLEVGGRPYQVEYVSSLGDNTIQFGINQGGNQDRAKKDEENLYNAWFKSNKPDFGTIRCTQSKSKDSPLTLEDFKQAFGDYVSIEIK